MKRLIVEALDKRLKHLLGTRVEPDTIDWLKQQVIGVLQAAGPLHNVAPRLLDGITATIDPSDPSMVSFEFPPELVERLQGWSSGQHQEDIMTMKAGARVGAIIGGNTTRVEVLGFGEYLGEQLPLGAGGVGPMLVKRKIQNPAIKLDNGDVVFGCECWWGPEHKLRSQIEAWRAAGAEIVEVRIADARAAYEAQRRKATN